MAEYSLKPVKVPQIKTKYRRIKTALPVPQSLPVFAKLRGSEPRSMSGQPPILWHKADNFLVGDKWGNQWIDWSSGVLITNTGHGCPEIVKAVRAVLDRPLLATYVFPHEDRATLTQMLRELAPVPSKYQVFLLSTGSEATENCIKLSKTYALQKYGPTKKYMISFQNAFHGRTMGSQLAGGIEPLKTWMVDRDRTFVQVPFPDGFRNPDTSFDLFLQSLAKQKVRPQDIAGVITESYQGGGPSFLPVKYAQQLEKFCRQHDIVLTMDEVQAGFGRTGEMFCFQHYGIKPDLIACGKGITSSLPLSAVIGRSAVLDLYAPGSMTSTHSASPLAVAAAIANLKVLHKKKLAARAAKLGAWFIPELERIQQKYPQRLGRCWGKGLVAGIQVVKPGTCEPDGAVALAINLACLYNGVLMFAPVGSGGGCVKIAPPLTIAEDALRESLAVFEQCVDEVMARL